MIRSRYFRELFFVLFIFTILSIGLSSCGLVKQVAEFDRFVKAKFTIHSVKLNDVAGINFPKTSSARDINFSDVIKLTGAILKDTLPSTLVLNVEVFNPFDKEAGVQGMEWKAMQNNLIVAKGNIEKPLLVAPHGKVSFPLYVNVNLSKLITLKNIQQLLGLFLNKSKPAEILDKLNITIGIRPYYKFGPELKKFPDYIIIYPNLKK